jgi:ABC-2 type transport system ATP-binding protein
VVLLDEPTSGLDPRYAHELRELLRRVRGQGPDARTVVISSHNLHELERLCDHVAFIDKGVAVAAGPTDVVTGRGQQIEIVLGEGPAPLPAVQSALAGATVTWDEAGRRLRVFFHPSETRQAEDIIGLALRGLLDAGARISEVRRGSTLEQKFLGMQ